MKLPRYFLGASCCVPFLSAIAILASGMVVPRSAAAQRPATDRHVRELARFFDGVKIASPIVAQGLAVYPVLVDEVPLLHGSWETLDDALANDILVIREKGGGSVPTVSVENRSRKTYVLLMMGDVIKGGMQTRTVRRDTVIAPGQRIDLDVFCVEAQRWHGETGFAAGGLKAPQSIQGAMRGGGSQSDIWSGVAKNNEALGAENATRSLEVAVKSRSVAEKLDAVRKRIVPEVPQGTVGYIFVHGGTAVGAEFFGSEALTRAEFPQLLDSYAVDYVILAKSDGRRRPPDNSVATDFFERICREGSERAKTAGSGAGIRTETASLLGDGVSVDATLVHYGVQPERVVVVRPRRAPIESRDEFDR